MLIYYKKITKAEFFSLILAKTTIKAVHIVVGGSAFENYVSYT